MSLENDKNDKVNQTKLLNKTDMIAKLADWVILFITPQPPRPHLITDDGLE